MNSSFALAACSAKQLRVVCRFSPTKNLRSGIAASANHRSNSTLTKRRDPSARKTSAAAEGARRRDGQKRRIKTSKITWIIASSTIALTAPNGKIQEGLFKCHRNVLAHLYFSLPTSWNINSLILVVIQLVCCFMKKLD